MKTGKQFALMAGMFVAASIVFSSCSKDTNEGLSEEYIKTNIVGKWKLVRNSLGDVLTDGRRINTYASNGKMYISEAREREGVFYWDNHRESNYLVKKDTLIQDFNYASSEADKLIVTNLQQEDLTLKFVIPREQGLMTEISLIRVTADYAKTILGLWEGVSMTGEPPLEATNYRIEFKNDGTYNYYEKVGNTWQVIAGHLQYILDGDWLAVRYKNEGQTEYTYEGWDIQTCTDAVLNFTALRERKDGTRYKSTFNWKKVIE